MSQVNIVLDADLATKLRQLQRELKEWAERAKKKKLRPTDIERMEHEANQLQGLIINREL